MSTWEGLSELDFLAIPVQGNQGLLMLVHVMSAGIENVSCIRLFSYSSNPTVYRKRGIIATRGLRKGRTGPSIAQVLLLAQVKGPLHNTSVSFMRSGA